MRIAGKLPGKVVLHERKKYDREAAGASGLLDHMESASCVMYQLGQLLWATGEKFRVTIECDPETGRFEAKRETIA